MRGILTDSTSVFLQETGSGTNQKCYRHTRQSEPCRQKALLELGSFHPKILCLREAGSDQEQVGNMAQPWEPC